MAEESFQERTEAPTPQRLEQARKDGQVPRSRDLSLAISLLAAALLVGVFGSAWWQAAETVLRTGLVLAGHPDGFSTALNPLLGQILLLLSPLLAVWLLTALAGVLPGGWIFAPNLLQPKFSRMDPMKYVSRTLGTAGMVELGKTLLKALLWGGVIGWWLWANRAQWAALSQAPLPVGAAAVGHYLGQLLWWAAGLGVLVALVDVPWQLWHHQKQLRMSLEDIKRENKEQDGDPHQKSRIRSLQREASKKRMMAAIPKADVVVVNPTHFAVALVYPGGESAPKVVAKGRGEVARRIREIAGEHQVPLLSAPALARALYQHVPLDKQIPSELYGPVAEVLTYVYRLKAPGPVPPWNGVQVPDGWDPGAS